MSLGREDILRELELLPMWQLRPGQTVSLSAAMPTTQAEAPALPETVVVAEVQAEQVEQVADISVAAHEPVARLTPLIETPWLLVSPALPEVDGQALLQAIIQAMQLPEQGWTLVEHAVSATDTQCRFVVLFGLQAATAFLGAPQAELQALRGKLHVLGDTQWIVTHHPREMLAQPALKREVWHDLCLLLSKKG